MTNTAPLLLDVSRLIWRRWKGRQPTGIDRVCLAYLEHFGPRSQAVIQHRLFRRILDQNASAQLFQMLTDSRTNFPVPFARMMLANFWKPNCPGLRRLYLNIGHTGLDSPGLRQWIVETNVEPIYFVHDLIPMTHPQFCRIGESERHRERMRTVLSTASGVIANSQATLGDLLEFARDEGLPLPAGTAAWLGTPSLVAPKREANENDPLSFVVVGTIEARKNHLMLLHIWRRLVARLKSMAPRLVIVGQRGWEADGVFAILDSDASLSGHVIEINDCSDEQLTFHLATARALLFPSHAEGFGLPLVEALALRVPVIASDLPALREIGQGIPTFIEPTNSAAWEAAVLDFASPQSAARSAQLRRMHRFHPPNWEGHFKHIEKWIATLLQSQGRL